MTCEAGVQDKKGIVTGGICYPSALVKYCVGKNCRCFTFKILPIRGLNKPYIKLCNPKYKLKAGDHDEAKRKEHPAELQKSLVKTKDISELK